MVKTARSLLSLHTGTHMWSVCLEEIPRDKTVQRLSHMNQLHWPGQALLSPTCLHPSLRSCSLCPPCPGPAWGGRWLLGPAVALACVCGTRFLGVFEEWGSSSLEQSSVREVPAWSTLSHQGLGEPGSSSVVQTVSLLQSHLEAGTSATWVGTGGHKVRMSMS